MNIGNYSGIQNSKNFKGRNINGRGEKNGGAKRRESNTGEGKDNATAG